MDDDAGVLIELLGSVLGKTPLINTLPEQPGDVRQTYADISRARAELGYKPSTPIREGLRRFVAMPLLATTRPSSRNWMRQRAKRD